MLYTLCVLVAMCGVVPVRCAVCCCSVTITVCCSGCGSGVVVGTRSGAGDVCCSSSLPREVVGEVAAVTATTQSVGGLKEKEVVAPATAVVAVVAGTCLVEDVGEGHVELPDAKARAARCR